MGKSEPRQRLPKTRRDPTAFVVHSLTERDVKIIETIARYRFILSPDIIRLVGGNADVTHRHLQRLYHRDLVSRTTIPAKTTNVPFVYFLENVTGLRELAKIGQIEGSVLDFEQVRLNQAKHSGADGLGHLLFLSHEIMISQFRADLEIEAMKSEGGGIVLERWKQGTELWDSIPPKHSDGSSLPFRPDAYFTLHFPGAQEGAQRSHFFYEADRQTSNRTRFKAKLEAYVQFFLRGDYETKYGARKVRAVLIETTSLGWMEQLKQTAAELGEKDPLAAAPLFWFTNGGLVRDKGILAHIWSCGVYSEPKSLLD